ncbi:MAG TPA: hypothetical protein PKW02_07900 [Pseudomonadales bacterium]|nr:hypothetical protein [Pseudomonadales bacterium]
MSHSLAARYLFLLPFLFFAAIIFFEISQTPFLYDSAIHIDAAKLLAHPPDRITPYSFELLSTTTSGPILTIAGALTTAVAGNHIWTPGLAAALLNLSIFLCFIFRLRDIFSSSAALTTSFFLAFILIDIQWWTLFLGEMPAILFFLIAITYAIDTSISTRRRYTFTALAIAFSLRAKMISLPMIGGIILYLAAEQYKLWQLDKKSLSLILQECVFALLILAISYILLYFPYHGVFLYAKSGDFFSSLQTNNNFLSSNSAMGIGKLLASQSPITAITDNISKNAGLLLSHSKTKFGIINSILIALSCAPSIFFLFKKQNLPTTKLIQIILLSASITSIWFFVINQAFFERYTLTIISLIFALSIFSLYRIHPVITPVFFLIFVLLSPAEQKSHLLQTLVLQKKTGDAFLLNATYNQNIIETTQYLLSNPPPPPLAKCGWMGAVWSVDYLLPQHDSFTDCYELMRSALSVQTSTNGEKLYSWKSPINFTLVTDKLSWRFSKFNAIARPMQNAVAKACRQNILYENQTFRVMRCTDDALKANLQPNEVGRFVDNNPIWKR